MFTKQSLFDTSCNAIIAQGSKSSTTEGCLYRGPEGKKCAIGHVVSDEQMAKYGITEQRSARVFPLDLFAELVPTEDPNAIKAMCVQLQSAHDQAVEYDFVNDFKHRANQIAREEKLTPIGESAK